jgi:hypothetical protein
MANKHESAGHDSKKPTGAAIQGGKKSLLRDQEGPGKQNPNPGNQGPHGSGEGITGMQPGDGHPRGR